MASLLTIMLSTLGLAWRAGIAQHRSTGGNSHHRLGPIDAHVNDDHEVLDACARTSVLVLIALLGLLVLGVMYGNVLGINQAPHSP